MKSIDKASKKYSIVRNATYWISALGGMAAVDSLFIPLINVTYGREKIIKNLAYVGVYLFSLAGGNLATVIGDSVLESSVDWYNEKIAKNAPDEESEEPVDQRAEPFNEFDTERVWWRLSDDQIFTFKSMDEAQAAHLHMIDIVDGEPGIATIEDLYRIRKRSENLPGSFSVLGWNKKDLLVASIDRVDSGDQILWILNLPQHRDFSNIFNTLDSDKEE